jgi:hypothetical protein
LRYSFLAHLNYLKRLLNVLEKLDEKAKGYVQQGHPQIGGYLLAACMGNVGE